MYMQESTAYKSRKPEKKKVSNNKDYLNRYLYTMECYVADRHDYIDVHLPIWKDSSEWSLSKNSPL